MSDTPELDKRTREYWINRPSGPMTQLEQMVYLDMIQRLQAIESGKPEIKQPDKSAG